MIPIFATVLLLISSVHAQSRCDAPEPTTYCNTTSILQYESSSCTPYHVFIARGSDEPYPGRLGNLTSLICDSLSSSSQSTCSFESVVYPAKSTAWGKDEWCKSAGAGAKNGQAQMRSYSQKCPQSKLIVLGFSQGGAVAQDMLGGGGGAVFQCVEPVTAALDRESAPGANVIAAATFGAVIRSRDQSFTIGEGKPYDGQRARTSSQLAALNRYASVLRDYCHYGDPMCAVGSLPESVTAHLNYFLTLNGEVVEWVVKMASASSASTQSSTQSSTASRLPTPPANAVSPSARPNSATPTTPNPSTTRSLAPSASTSGVTSTTEVAPTSSGQTSTAVRGMREGRICVAFALLLWLAVSNAWVGNAW